jgi:hypothetical protein
MYAVPLRASVAPHFSQAFFSSNATFVPRPVYEGHCDHSYHFVVAVWRAKGRIQRVKYWEIIADNLSKAGWSLGLRFSLGL